MSVEEQAKLGFYGFRVLAAAGGRGELSALAHKFVNVFFPLSRCDQHRFPFGKPCHEPCELLGGERPLERRGDLLIAVLEREQAMRDVVEVGEVVGVSTLRCTIEN